MNDDYDPHKHDLEMILLRVSVLDDLVQAQLKRLLKAAPPASRPEQQVKPEPQVKKKPRPPSALGMGRPIKLDTGAYMEAVRRLNGHHRLSGSPPAS